MTEGVVSELTLLAETGATHAPVDKFATAKRYIDEAKAQLPKTDQEKLSVVMNATHLERAAADKAFQQAITAFADAAKTDNLCNALDRAHQAHLELQTLSRAHQILEGAFANAQEQTNFLQTRWNEAVGKLPQEDRDALAKFLTQPDVQNLANTCADLGGNPNLGERDPTLARHLNAMSVSLKMIAQAAGSPLPERALGAGASRPGGDPGPRVSAAIFEHFSIVVGKELQSTPVSREFQQYFADNFPALQPSDLPDEEPHLQGDHTRGQWLPSYVIDGKPIKKGDNAAAQAALLDLCGTPEIFRVVTRIANQKPDAFAYKLLLSSADGAIRLPDGRSVRPIKTTSKFSNSIEIGKNASGEITVTTRSDYTDIENVVDQDNQYLKLVPGAEIHYSVEITVATDGSSRVSRPLEFQISSFIPR